MTKYSFKNDYSEGAHNRILEALIESNLLQKKGYGEDNFCKEAKNAILKKIGDKTPKIHFISGGTQANLTLISSMLKPYESVIAPSTGHIAVHEAGAIEATGHKVNTVETNDGKLTPHDVKKILNSHSGKYLAGSMHMVQPKLVFISNSTEAGTIYKKDELQKLSKFCKNNDLYLLLDGARLGLALTSEHNDLTLADISSFVDAFFIGGTKNGALLGEAIVLTNDKLKKDFRFYLKQRGALLAKGSLLGIQFLELFKDDLFFNLGKHANKMATKLVNGIKKLNYDFLTEPVSNQIFPILPNKLIEKLNKNYSFYIWKKAGTEKSAIRLVTSWATKEEFVDKFILDLE